MKVEVADSVEAVRRFLDSVREKDSRVGLVPTMGALHDGHVALIRRARRDCTTVVLSIYVNPAQFGPSEDLDSYPRTFRADRKVCEQEGVDLIFAPSDKLMYPKGYATYVEVEELTGRLCGRSRPVHFRGVTTVCAKLFHIVAPDVAYFGWKDAQQVMVIRRMVEDLNLPVAIEPVETVREPDGLALSSRNQYLDEQARSEAAEIYAALEKARWAFEEDGTTDAESLMNVVRRHIEENTGGEIDYVEMVSLDRIQPIDRVAKGNTLLAAAVHLGGARLIDNIRL